MLSLALSLLLARGNGVPAAPREFRGVWVATVDNIDWPPRNVYDVEKQKERLRAILDEAQQIHLNAVVFQVRPMADAMYSSTFEPWSEFLTGAQGKPPDPVWDPLQFAVEQAHQRGLELHAWFNPYRVWLSAAKGKPASNYIGYTHPNWVKTYGKLKWLDPGEKGVEGWSEGVIMDVVRRYDIDGVHMDDYFYPYPVRDSQKQEVPFPDDESWNAYVATGGKLSRGDWRRRNVDELVSNLYKDIKRTKSWVKFGISPFGIYRPGMPSSIKAGIDQYNQLYSDPVKWLRNGWVDYLTPQLYWRISQTAQSYPVLARWWSEQNPLHRHLWIGNNLSQVSAAWSPEEILNQIQITRQAGAGGDILFSMTPLMKDSKGIDEKLESGPYSEPALVPSCPWLKSAPPSAPRISVQRSTTGYQLSLRRESGDTYQWAIYLRGNGDWHFDHLVSARELKLSVTGGAGSEIAISALDRYGNESERVVARLP